MKKIWIRNACGTAALAACLIAASAMAQMGGGGMSAPSGMGGQQPGQMQRPGMQPGQNGLNSQNGMNSMLDQSFLRGIAENSLVEMNLSQLAQKNSSNDNVKQLAQQIIRDHQRMSSEISEAASSRNVVLPNSMPGHAKKDEKKMQELTGTEFDQAYLKALDRYMKEDQNRVSQQAGAASTSPDMRQLAMQVQNMTQARSQQITEVAKSENLALK